MSLLVEALYDRVTDHAGLAALVGTRIYPNHEVPQGSVFPYISYGEVSDVPTHVLGGHSGFHETRWQFDVWDDDYLGAAMVREQLRLALDSSIGTNLGVAFHCYLVNAVAVPEAGAQARDGVSVTHFAVDFMTQATEPAPQEV